MTFVEMVDQAIAEIEYQQWYATTNVPTDQEAMERYQDREQRRFAEFGQAILVLSREGNA